MAELVFQFQETGVFRDKPFWPSTLDRVEIEEDSGGSVETVQQSGITTIKRGGFSAEVDEDLYDDSKGYIARWFYKIHGTEFEVVQHFDPVVLSDVVDINFNV